MPKFNYVVKDSEGKSIQSVAEAENRAELIKRLQAQKYFIVSVEEAIAVRSIAQLPPAANRKFTHSRVKLIDKLVVARQMATMLGAGVNLTRTLQVLLNQVDSSQFHQVLRRVSRDVESGLSVSMAMAQHPKVFDQFWVSLVEVGEASGTMPHVLNKMADHLEREELFRSTIISGVIYPFILICVSIAAVMFFALFVGPRFQNVFQNMGVELPALTRILLVTFDFIRANIIIITILVSALIFFIVHTIKNTLPGKIFWERMMFSMPNFGEIYNLGLVERFCSQMSILIESGVPILYALDIVERMIDNHTFGEVINKIKDNVRRGENISASMGRTGFFPQMAVQMVVVGEETGQLSQMLGYVAKYYEELITRFMKRFSTVIEPLIIIFMGVVIGVIVTAMFLPLFNIARIGGVR